MTMSLILGGTAGALMGVVLGLLLLSLRELHRREDALTAERQRHDLIENKWRQDYRKMARLVKAQTVMEDATADAIAAEEPVRQVPLDLDPDEDDLGAAVDEKDAQQFGANGNRMLI